METQTLKDINYAIIGYIVTDSSGKQTIKDANYMIKGYYDPKTNETTDSDYRLIGRGNFLTTLL